MPLRGHTIINIEGVDDPVSIDYTLEDADVTTLEAFCKYVEELSTSALVKNGIPTSFKLNYKAGEGFAFSAILPDWNQVAVLLHRLRPLILTSEHASYDRVSGILGRTLADPYVRQILKDNREIYTGKRFQRQIQMTSNDTLLNSERVLIDYLNAFEYHRDQNKAEELDRLHRIIPLESSKAIFLDLLSEKVDAVFEVASLVFLVLGKRDSLSAQISKKPGSNYT